VRFDELKAIIYLNEENWDYLKTKLPFYKPAHIVPNKAS